MSHPYSSRSSASSSSYVRVNGKIRAREVRVIGHEGQQLGVIQLSDALNLARQQGVDLVEIAPNATPPVCRIVDYGKFRYEQAKKDKDSRKHQHANKVKEVQLSPSISPHDFGVKLTHAIDFLCEDMKVKISLRFRGREMAHQEFGFQVVEKFVKETTPYGHPDNTAKLIGKGINVMISPLPRNKRARNPRQDEIDAEALAAGNAPADEPNSDEVEPASPQPKPAPKRASAKAAEETNGGFGNNPFTELDIKVGQ